ncbi:hypothetical protein DPEC_G00175550 [Dallia pectoralis]|uniref:Uncharacterized protein n=1 Tax=Dallia pectoralis TaxID=75939 RepID=A0ACC2GEL2_DALPE|nr:hypothetical protein DPEC_G00175550 [Dallia pectoralis]
MEMLSTQGPIFLLTCLAVMAVTSEAFNIDMLNPSIYQREQQALFGYKVIQFSSDKEKGVMVSAPYQKNGSGGVCRWVQNQTKCLDIQEKNSTSYNGLSLAGPSSPENSNSPPMFTACTPGLAHECDGNVYLNSICYQFNSQLENISEFRPAFQECTKKKVNLVFLFDGSRSMTTEEFDQNKIFIQNIMTTLKNSSIEFAAVQFSTKTRTVFNFYDYQAGTALDKLHRELHMKELTNTYSAINFLLENIFENVTAGATPDATKVLVIITDGDPSETDSKKSIQQSNEKHIIRFVIGVKKVNITKLKSLASDPKEDNTFLIKDYNGFTDILDNFQKKIFNIEGSKIGLAETLTNEMSQCGFSVDSYKNTLVLGSVGSNNWRGSLYETVVSKTEEREIQDPNLDKDSYMGYSVAVGKTMKNLLYFTGAPRSEHMGKILLFKKVDGNWNLTAKIPGEQIGSYFGAELCSVDIDSDGNTDFLLVGAPLFHQPQREGKIYVYRLTDKLDLMPEMNVSVPSSGRFGSSISSLSDLNGDGLNDVAVGAPLEDNHSGAVYIYLGERLMGIRPKFSQRISASMMKSQKMPSNLQFFGQTIDGKIDLGEDGLPDIVVGARGAIVVLRSRPVLNVTAKIHFHPLRISTYNFDCLAKDDTISKEFTITVCFNIAEATQSNDGTPGAGTNISYLLDVDPVRQRSRAFYSVKDKDARRHLSTVELRDAKTCFNHSVYMTACVIDTLSPIIIKMNFSQTDSQLESPTAILNTDSLTQAVVEVPFEKNCKRNETCVADLQVDFSFINSTIVVDEQSYCIVAIRLSNQGDDSYNTSLTLLYPPGLSFSMMSLVKSTRRTLINCGQDDEAGKTTCTVSLPVFRSQTTAEFSSKFHISNTYDWNNTMEMTVIGMSDNGNSTNSSVNKTIPVQFAVDLIAKVAPKNSITYVNFTLKETSPRKLLNVYEVQNLGSTSLPITVVFIFPTTLGSKLKLKDYQISVSKNHTQCGKVMNSTTEFCSPEKNWKSIKCESFILEQSLTVTFELSGSVAIKNLEQHAQGLSLSKKFTGDRESVHFITFVKVNYDKKRYIQTSSDRRDYANATSYHQTQIEVLAEIIIPPDRAFIIGIGVTGGLLLLVIMIVVMYKVGFFKRNRDFGEIQEEQEVYENFETAVGETVSETKSPSNVENSQLEVKPLVSNSQAENNGCQASKGESE